MRDNFTICPRCGAGWTKPRNWCKVCGYLQYSNDIGLYCEFPVGDLRIVIQCKLDATTSFIKQLSYGNLYSHWENAATIPGALSVKITQEDLDRYLVLQ